MGRVKRGKRGWRRGSKRERKEREKREKMREERGELPDIASARPSDVRCSERGGEGLGRSLDAPRRYENF